VAGSVLCLDESSGEGGGYLGGGDVGRGIVESRWPAPAAGLGTAAGSSAAGRCSRMPDSSLTAMSSARAGQPAMIRLIVPVSAVAMLAARLAAVPITRAAQGSQPDRRPARRSASRTRDATISTPSTESGKAWACQPVSPCAAARIRMWL